MEWTILFAGPVGAGKTQAVSTISDIEVVCTEELATDETRTLKPHTTVALDVGVMNLGAGDKVRLLGSPGQGRFDFMWDILIEQAKGLVLLIDHSREESVADLEHYLAQLRARMGSRPKPIVIGITSTWRRTGRWPSTRRRGAPDARAANVARPSSRWTHARRRTYSG